MNIESTLKNKIKCVLTQTIKPYLIIPALLMSVGLLIIYLAYHYDTNNIGIVSQPSNALLLYFILLNSGSIFLIGGIIYLKLNFKKGDY